MPKKQKRIYMAKNKSIKVLQITDSHLFAKNQEMFGVKCNENFLRVIEKIKQHAKPFDFILATGDISQDESQEAYQLFRDTLAQFKVPIYWIPGNHDDLIKMQAIFQQSPYFFHQQNLTVGDWEFIFVDTKIQGKDTGFISDEELNKLGKLLAQSQASRVAIVMHHHPIPVSTPLIDKYILENREDFLSMINQYKKVRLIICGHVHGDYTITAKHFSLETSPATCLQWPKDKKDLKIDYRMGYKVYQFSDINYIAQGFLWE